MMVSIQSQKKFLKNLQSLFEESGQETLLGHPSDNPALDMLAVRFDFIGEKDAFLDLNINFIPLDDMSPFYLLQFFLIVSDEVTPEAADELYIVTNTISEKIPIGAFGYLPDRNVCYFKHNYIMPNNFEESIGLYLRMVQYQCILLRGILNSFIDSILAVVEQKLTAQNALQSGQLAQFFGDSSGKETGFL
ncbi:hypothetical protein [Planktothricoides raciborskii]|uniref:Uncharacterized protein n=2 Tax=Planktothricoides raciborskii TaxID=132608 RepID=A0AAU8J9K3_9CYAN|nr:hypothetical protein [Planktothricoides raciborskii]MBD2544640.1 hypothetical protein [Planktothricoides raciborskii FACHB-1370]MBD2580725.1 hypothetical protein [Planktothricoides raciborskii FACHB-1261]